MPHKHGNRFHPETCAPKETIRALYATAQLSTRQIAARTGFSKSYIHKICSGLTRSMRDAAIIRQPPTSKHWRSSRQAARKAMERLLGRKLLTTEDVHHIDEDFTNNSIDNLEVLDEVVHAHKHHPVNPIPRHQRPARKIWLAEYDRRVRRVIKTVCVRCGVEFLADKWETRKQRYCTRVCYLTRGKNAKA